MSIPGVAVEVRSRPAFLPQGVHILIRDVFFMYVLDTMDEDNPIDIFCVVSYLCFPSVCKIGRIYFLDQFFFVSYQVGILRGIQWGQIYVFVIHPFISPDDLSIFMINILAVDVFVILLFDDPWLGLMVFYLSFFHPLVIPGGCLLYYSNLSYIIILYRTHLYFIHSLPYVPVCSFQLFI